MLAAVALAWLWLQVYQLVLVVVVAVLLAVTLFPVVEWMERRGLSRVAATFVTLGFFLTLYLLIEAEATRDWALAFVPRAHRPRMEQTLAECRSVTFAYIAGNAITSVIALVCTIAVLSLLKVPAALLLALIAGLSNFVPVIGFIIGAIPTMPLAMTVSTTTAFIVMAFTSATTRSRTTC